MYNVDLTGKFAVVTGGSRGIGYHVAQALSAAGARVAITGRNLDTLQEAAEDIGEQCHPYVCDQKVPKAIQELAEAVLAEHGSPDILVNNAASISAGRAVVDLPLKAWCETIDTNLTGVFLTTQVFLPGMIERESGDIFMISSMSGKKGDRGWAAYCASKFGLQGLSQCLQYEVRGRNIRVMVVNPSSVNTDHDVGPTEGPGLHLHAADIAATLVHMCGIPRRTLIRDMDIWGTNP